MSLIDEFNAATNSLDKILQKLAQAQPSDKQSLEIAAKGAQAKVQDILLAIQRLK